MSKILNTQELRSSVADELRSSKAVTLLSAYITSLGVEWLLQALPAQASLAVVGRFLPIDFIRGASDLNAVRMLLERGHTVKSLSSLHAKIISIDNEKVFLGSANWTGRGLGLVEHHNLEASVNFKADREAQELISSTIHAASNVTIDTVDRMESHLSEISSLYDEIKIDFQDWPQDFYQNKEVSQLYVKDFPLAQQGVYNEAYDIFIDSDYSKIYKQRNNEKLAEAIFKNSKSYIWLVQVLSQEINREGVSFGKMSRYIHEVLADDPSPYRRTVKDLQSNLYGFVSKYANDVVEFYTPGERSLFIRLRL